MKSTAKSVQQRAKRIKVLLMDVDGVLTDGKIHLVVTPEGTAQEMKSFHAHDGAGLKLGVAAGLRTGVITGRISEATTRRAREVSMEFVCQNRPEKLPAYEEILQSAGVRDAEVAYIGDDLPDLPVLRRVGLAIAVANAVPELKKVAHYVTKRPGGDGAVREVIELLLRAQGKWDAAIKKAQA